MVVPQGTILYETSSFLHIGSSILQLFHLLTDVWHKNETEEMQEKWLVVNYDILQ